ncbi:ABC transporter substrate-binding protein [bacterium]|nr:ABC transporter substrate-binding protein [bacterium]
MTKRFIFTFVFLIAFSFNLPLFAETKVGVIVPLSGALAEYGVAIRNGIQMAQKDNPELFASCNFLYEDSKYDPKTAISAFNKLVSSDKINIAYNFGGPTSAAIAPVASKTKTPSLLWTTDPSAVARYEYVIRFTNDAIEFTKSLANYLNSNNQKRLGVVITENQYLNSILNGLKTSLVPGQTLEVIDTVQPSDTDFRSIVTKLQKNSYDSIGVFMLSGQIGQFYRQLQQQNKLTATFGTDFFESSTEIKSAEGGMNGAVYTNNTVPSSFAQKYKSLYGNDLQLTYAGNGYDFATLACRTLAKQQSAEGIMSILEAAENRSGVLGNYNFIKTAAGDKFFRFPVAVKKIEGSEFKDL